MEEQEVDVLRVADEEDFVAGGDQMSGFLVGAETDLFLSIILATCNLFQNSPCSPNHIVSCSRWIPHSPAENCDGLFTYRWHHKLTLESSSNSVVDTLWLSPC